MARVAICASAAVALALGAGCESGTPRGVKGPASAEHGAPPAGSEKVGTATAGAVATPPVVSPVGAPSTSSAVTRPPSGTRAPCNVALIGDSITDYRSFGGGYVRYLEQRCPASRFSNYAKGGAMVNQMRARFETSLANEARGTFSHIVIFGGVNDLYSDETAGRTPPKIEADLGALYAGARALGARVVAITVAPWGGFTRWFTEHRARTTRELNAWILEQPADGSVDTVVDAFSLLSCGEADRLCDRYERSPSDGLHFGKAGHEVLGAALYEREFHTCL
jgi:lysophospholipase L1-like esterase